jgi:hypothetical protein
MERETVGKVAYDLSLKTPETLDPIEIERTLHTDYEKNVLECIDRGLKDFSGDFYVVVITKKEPIMANVLRHYYFNRSSCPTPDYDQAVYHYLRSSDSIEFIWVIPSKFACQLLMDNRKDVAPSEYGLLECVIKFADGTLHKTAKTLNGEEPDSNLLIVN